MNSNPNNGQDAYLEPLIEIHGESIDPLAASDSTPDNNNICPPGGC